MSSPVTCPVCGEPNTQRAIRSQGQAYDYDCRRCGFYVIDGLLQRIFENADLEHKKLLRHLSAYVRQNQSKGLGNVRITRENYKDLALAERAVSVPQKIEKLLRLIASRTEVAGEKVAVDDQLDAPLVNAVSEDEFRYLLRYLKETGYIDHIADTSARLSVKGWQTLEPPIGGGGIPGRCFVAMSFNPELDNAWRLGIEPALKECGFQGIRVDKQEHNRDINDMIIAEVKKAQFVVADFTEHKAGVYFEAGFARGLGREVIWCCREPDFDKTHFDTNHYSHIIWQEPSDLKEQLVNRILATIVSARLSNA